MTINKSLGLKTLVLVLAMSAVLIYMIADRAMLLASETTVLLRTAPVDPTSLFRGDYVILNYDISRLNPQKLDGDDQFKRHNHAYVVLEPQDNFWTAVGVYVDKPKIEADQAAMRGLVKYVSKNKDGQITNLSLEYGIESYFVPEGKGKNIEDAIRTPINPVTEERTTVPVPPTRDIQTETDRSEIEETRVMIEVALGRDGVGAIKTLFLDGEAYYQETVF